MTTAEAKALTANPPMLRNDRQGVAAAVHGWGLQFISLLLVAGAGAAIDARDKAGVTPLHLAAQIGNLPAVRALRAAGASSSVVDSFGFLPSERAAFAGYMGVAQEIVDRSSLPVSSHVLGKTDSSSAVLAPILPKERAGWGPARTLPVVPGENLLLPKCDIDIRSDLNMKSFRSEFFSKQKPVLIRGGLKGLPQEVLADWDADALKTILKDAKLQTAKVETGKRSYSSESSLKSFLAVIAKYEAGLSESHAESKPMALSIVEARWNAYPALHKLVMGLLDSPTSVSGWLGTVCQPYGCRLNNYQLNIAGPYSGTSLHYHYGAMSTLLHGRKRWFLYPPNEAFYSTAHFFDDFEKSRDGSFGTHLECTQMPGDVLFIPSLWGHGVLYEETSVSVSFLYDL